MKSGGWVPVCKVLVRHLPKDRPFSKVEAAFSLQLDYDQGKQATVSGYADLWRWSRGKVERFLKELGVMIKYPESTDQKQNQNGQIMIQITSRSRAENEQIRLIDSKWLEDEPSRTRADNEQKASRSQSTTIDPNPNPDKNNIPFSAIVDHLNSQTGKRFRASTRETRKYIKARWNEGFRLEDFFRVIDNKVASWAKDLERSIYLRPETLFGPKFEGYLNENGNGSRPMAHVPPTAPPKEFDFENQFKGE